MIIRRFQVTDANEISALFREIYAERYVYSDLYVPAMITWRNTQHNWYSAVAVINNKIIGHAALRRENNHATCGDDCYPSYGPASWYSIQTWQVPI